MAIVIFRGNNLGINKNGERLFLKCPLITDQENFLE